MTEQGHLSYTSKPDNLEEMDQPLQTLNLPRLNHKETENLNRLISSKETESVIKMSQHRKAQDQMVSLVNSTKHERKNTNPSQTLRKLLNSLYGASITLKPKPEDTTRKDNYPPISWTQKSLTKQNRSKQRLSSVHYTP